MISIRYISEGSVSTVKMVLEDDVSTGHLITASL